MTQNWTKLRINLYDYYSSSVGASVCLREMAKARTMTEFYYEAQGMGITFAVSIGAMAGLLWGTTGTGDFCLTWVPTTAHRCRVPKPDRKR